MKSPPVFAHGRQLLAWLWWLPLLFCASVPAADDSFMQRVTREFADSQIEFQRSGSNAPFMPVAALGATFYGSAEVDGRGKGVEDLQYDVSTVSQFAGLPILLGQRDALIIGEYLSWSDFSVEGKEQNSFEVSSIGLTAAWLRQVNPAWQIAAFVMPMGHHDNMDGSTWTWQYMGGTFARYVQHDRLWWAFGLYADVAPGDNFYIPYVGASWVINERWTLSAVMPWPALLYAPSRDWLLRLGASPSGSSWSFKPNGGDATLNLDAWDFGVGVERRLGDNLWLAAEAGVGGFRGLRLSGSDLESPDLDVSTSPYVGIKLNIRPSMRDW